MSSSSHEPKTIRWGILATGGIAQSFAKDLLVDPTTRGVTHIKHSVAAAASSTSAARAREFLQTISAPSDAKAYGSYAELAADPDVDIIYIATPHSHHYQNTRQCLEAGKHVLCEKAFTVNAPQLAALIALAKSKDLFLMEAVWTRYFPLSIYVRGLVASGKLGAVHRTSADLSMWSRPERDFADGSHRMVNASLAGGALLDLGIYSLTWVFQTLFTTQPGPTGAKAKPAVAASVVKYAPTGVDEADTVLLTFPRAAEQGGPAQGIASTSLRLASDPGFTKNVGPAIRVQGVEGEVQVFAPAFRPTRTRWVDAKGKVVEDKEWPQPGPGKGSGWFNGFGSDMNAEGEGHGMFWEADEAGTAVLEGRRGGGKYLDLEESLVIMEVMDEVRRQGGIVYPKDIETLDYPVELK